MRHLLMLLVCLFLPLVGAEAPKLPPKAQEAMDKLEKSEGKLTAEYKRSLNAERAKTITELQKAQKDITKSGDLDAALAVKKQIEALQQKIADDEDTDLLGNKKEKPDPAKALIGKWDFQKSNGVGGVIDFKADGSMAASITMPINFPYVPGKWEIKEDKVLLTWLNDATKIDTLGFTALTKLAGDTHDAGKNSFNATKQTADK
jgi:thioesterase domain-containing protein